MFPNKRCLQQFVALTFEKEGSHPPQPQAVNIWTTIAMKLPFLYNLRWVKSFNLKRCSQHIVALTFEKGSHLPSASLLLSPTLFSGLRSASVFSLKSFLYDFKKSFSSPFYEFKKSFSSPYDFKKSFSSPYHFEKSFSSAYDFKQSFSSPFYDFQNSFSSSFYDFQKSFSSPFYDFKKSLLKLIFCLSKLSLGSEDVQICTGMGWNWNQMATSFWGFIIFGLNLLLNYETIKPLNY